MKIVDDDTAISIIQTQELPDDGSLLKDTLNIEIMNDETLLSAEYMAVKGVGNANDFDMYRILDYETAGNTTRFTGVQLAYYELEGYIIEDIRPTNQTISYVLNQILTGTDWRVGYVDSGISNITDTFYYLSAKESLKQIQTITNTEMIFKVEISGSKITDKWVEVYHQLGDRTLKRFNYGSNVLTITREISKTELFTALIGRGKGEQVSEDGYGRKIDFADIEWKKSSGKPVDKPIGQNYVELPQATAEFGIATISGVKKPRIGIVEFDDETDPAKLLQSTYDQLLNYARPKVLFKSTVANIGATNIGDTVTIHRHDLDIHYETRVFKVVRDKLNDDKTQIELGDVTYQPITRQKQTIDSALNKVEREVIRQVNYVQASADGKNAVNYGSIEPSVKRVGDLWYRPHPSIAGETQMLTWNGTVWEELKYRVDQLTGEIDANKLRVINIDANNITANKTSFVESAWNGINNTVSVNASGIRSANSNGDWTLYHSGAISFGGGSSQGIYLEYADGSRNGLAINNRGALNTEITLDLMSSARNTLNFGRRTDTNGYDFRIDHYQGTKVSFDGRGIQRYTFNINSDAQSHAISILGHGATSGYNSGSGLSIGMETADGATKGSRFYFSSASDLVWLSKDTYNDLKPLAVFDLQFRWGQSGRKSLKDVLDYLSRAAGVDINNIPDVV